jgi:hypothetical protein
MAADRIRDLEAALRRERDRASALDVGATLESARGITARLLASGARSARAEAQTGSQPRQPEAHPWRRPAWS